jgi:hypothetical protein
VRYKLFHEGQKVMLVKVTRSKVAKGTRYITTKQLLDCFIGRWLYSLINRGGLCTESVIRSFALFPLFIGHGEVTVNPFDHILLRQINVVVIVSIDAVVRSIISYQKGLDLDILIRDFVANQTACSATNTISHFKGASFGGLDDDRRAHSNELEMEVWHDQGASCVLCDCLSHRNVTVSDACHMQN